jgi:hypothetical protein
MNFDKLELTNNEDSFSANEVYQFTVTKQNSITMPKVNGGRSSTTKGESSEHNAYPFVVAEDAKSDISGGIGYSYPAS